MDLILSPWAKVGGYDLDFNMGRVETPVSGGGRFGLSVPMTLDGDIAVAVTLQVEDMARLRADAKFCGKYREYIG